MAIFPVLQKLTHMHFCEQGIIFSVWKNTPQVFKCGTTSGSVSAGRGKWPTNVFFFNWSFRMAKPKDFDDFFRFMLTKYDLGMLKK